MRKRIYLLTAAAVMTGIMVTACAPKNDKGLQTSSAAETTAQETESEERASEESEAAEASADEVLSAVHTAVKAAYGENYIPSMSYDAETLKKQFGVKAELCEAVIAEGPMISVHVETFIGVKAKKGKGGEVKAALDKYRQEQLEDSMQYPMNMVKLEASEVVEKGDYVFFVMLGSADEQSEEAGEEPALESAKKNNQKAIDAINRVLDKE